MEARKIRGLQGIALYGLATLRALWYHYRTPLMTLTLDDGPPTRNPTLMLSVLVGRREGGFVLAPDARLNDGLFDFLHARDLSRFEVMRFLPRLALAGPPKDHAKLHQGRCRKLHLVSDAPLVVHGVGTKPSDSLVVLDAAQS